MTQKPYRFVLDRVAGYAEEVAAFLRRRRLRSEPFARVSWAGGTIRSFDAEAPEGAALFLAAADVIGLAGSEKTDVAD